MKKFVILFVYWWAIIFPSLNFENQNFYNVNSANSCYENMINNSEKIEFRFKILEVLYFSN